MKNSNETNCLQCDKVVTGYETIGTLQIRVCADGHRTAKATPAMVKNSAKWRAAALKASKESVIDYQATQPEVKPWTAGEDADISEFTREA
jgi:hypothetical protein